FCCLSIFSGCAAQVRHDLRGQKVIIEDLEQRVEQQEQEMSGFQDHLDQLDLRMEKMRQETASRLMDMEFRLEPVQMLPGPSPHQDEYRSDQTSSVQVPAAKEITPPEKTVDEVKKEPEPELSSKPQIVNKPENNEKASYDQALKLYFAEKSQEARDAFNRFIENYPKSSLTPNVWYWMAETHYAEKNYPRAILSFREVLDKYPDDAKALDSLLKIGYAYERLGDLKNALFYLSILVQDYPDSKAAKKAGTKIKEIRTRM
ncbi:MAG: tol-pal system protein YbgF, partial [Desulfonatronovibrio sp.]